MLDKFNFSEKERKKVYILVKKVPELNLDKEKDDLLSCASVF